MIGPAYAETYIGGQFGMALPSIGGGLKDIEITTQFLPGTKHSDLTLSNSAMGGLKVGHYFQGARWFGIEGEFFATSPHIQQQTHTFTNPTVSCSNCTGTLQGAHFRVMTLAPLNLMFRLPKYRLQPYIGIGPALFFARISGENISSPSTSASTSNNGVLGFNGKVGVEYYFTKHFTAFAEWKYNYAQFNFKENTDLYPFPYGFKTTYTMNLVSFGLSVHF
jgi:opacity protein-like surface antigen